jgi:aquaporin Z
MKKYLAELIGTFVLVFGGVGSAVLAGSHIGFLGVSFAFGLSLLAMVYTIGPISGCHINPAVTLGVLLARKIGAKDALAYVIAQTVGAVIASGVILFIARGAASGYDLAAGGLGSTDIKAPVGFAGLAIGLVLTLIHLVGIPITNTSVNPARSIGPALFVGGWAIEQLWLFIVAPLVGGAIAAAVYGAIRIPAELITTPQAERALKSQQAERGRV